MPKCGSTTMQKILNTLKRINGYTLHNIYVAQTRNQDNVLLDALKTAGETYTFPTTTIILKHHTFMNFSSYNLPQPTYLNVVRDPIDRWTSEYYFCRYGWGKKKDYKGSDCVNMTEVDLNRSIDDCVQQGVSECADVNPDYLGWLCGNDPVCMSNDKAKVAEFTKRRVLEDFYVIGILEDFENTCERFLKFFIDIIFLKISNIFQTFPSTLI